MFPMVTKTRSLLKDLSTLLTNPLIRIVKNISKLYRNGRRIRKRNIVPNVNFCIFLKISKKFSNVLQNSEKFCAFFSNLLARRWYSQKSLISHLEKCCKMRFWTRKSALIQPRTSLGKSARVVAGHNHSFRGQWSGQVPPLRCSAPCTTTSPLFDRWSNTFNYNRL